MSARVLIDNEKIKHPNTGLHAFGIELATAIEQVKAEYNVQTTYLLKKVCLQYLPSTIASRIIKPFDKLFFLAGRKIDVVHATSQFCRFLPLDAKIVLTVHDLNFLYEKSDKKQAKYLRRLQRAIDRASHIVAISEYAKSDVLKHLKVGAKPLDVIYNGCSFYQGKGTQNPGYKPQRKFLFTIGTVLAKKNFHVLPALLQDNDYELLIAGNPSDYSQQIIAEAEKYGVADRVKLLGGISEAEKDWYYTNCRAFLFPSVAEGFGLPVIEALHYGKPTFISQHTSLPEIGKDHCFYFDYEFDRKSMQETLHQGLAAFTEEHRQRQIEYAHTYSWVNAARAYCEIYNNVIK